jgi:hypothetical protein
MGTDGIMQQGILQFIHAFVLMAVRSRTLQRDKYIAYCSWENKNLYEILAEKLTEETKRMIITNSL